MMAVDAPKPVAPWPEPPGGYKSALITPSYYVDFEHCRWLVESVNRYVREDIPHYLIVDRLDRSLFAPLASSRTKILFKEDVLRGRLRQLPFARRWWVGLKTPPVRGWIVQQLTKLFVHELVSEDVYVFVDSGCFYVRPYDPNSMISSGLVRLFRENGDYFRKEPQVAKWHSVAAKLLGLKPVRGYDAGYVSQLVTWRRDNLIKMHRHIEDTTGSSSFEGTARALTLSEYYLYGMYSDMILGDRAGHYRTPVSAAHCYWYQTPLSVDDLRRFRDKLEPHHCVVLVNEKSRTPITAVREAFSTAA